MTWQFAALLIGALVVSMLLSLWQHRRYTTEVNQLARQYAGQDLKLVSGRGKGRLKGAVVVLLVNPRAGKVVEARKMVGSTVFSRLGPAPELVGSLAGVAGRATDKYVRIAVEAALGMLPAAARPVAAASHPGRPKVQIPKPQPRQVREDLR